MFLFVGVIVAIVVTCLPLLISSSLPGHHVSKSQASDKSLAKNEDLEPMELFVL